MNMQPQPAKPLEEGDEFFLGVDMRDPRTLGPGLLNAARNIRYADFVPQTRKGVIKPGWANRVDATARQTILPWGTIYGGNTFRDPDSRAWGILAADGGAYRLLPYNQAASLALPTGVKLLGPVTFCQAFDKVYCFRGQFLAPLRMSDFDTGFEDVLPHLDSTAAYAVGTEIAYGPFQAVTSITSVGNTATVITTSPHGYITGADITHRGASQAEYNVRANITVVDELTYTYPFAGSATTPATGTIKASNMIQYWKAAGTLWTLTTLTHSTTTATATKTAHGIPNGARITIAGATPSGYNGTFTVTGVTANNFTYTLLLDPGSDATGTITVRDLDNTLAGHTPDTSANDWTRVWNILPNADNALYINNRMLVPTAYEPSSADNYATFNGGSYKKKDYLVATDYLDDIHFDFANEFRINQGSADEIVDLAKFNENTVVIWKGSSWGVLSNVALALTQLTLDFRNFEYGLAARGAWTLAGSLLYFVATKRGVVGVQQSENGKLLGVDLPLSAPIQKLIDRIDWTRARGIRMANWDSKLYCAVRLDNGVLYGPDLARLGGQKNFDVAMPASVGWWSQIDGFEPGATYEYVLGNSRALLTEEIPVLSGIGPGRFVAHQSTYFLAGTASGPVTAKLRKVRTAQANALLVYDLVAAARAAGQGMFNNFGWCGSDTGSAICPIEFFKMPLDGLERLFFLGDDGFVNLMEESYDGDEVPYVNGPQLLGREEIETYTLTRAYLKTDTRLSKPTAGTLVLQTLNPNYSARMLFSGVNKTTTLATDKTRSATRYFRPFDKAAWNVTNVNHDHDTQDREDYRVAIGSGGLYLGSGVQLDRFQEVIHNFRVNGRSGRSFQIEVTNTTGRIKLLGVGIEAMPGRERKGLLT